MEEIFQNGSSQQHLGKPSFPKHFRLKIYRFKNCGFGFFQFPDAKKAPSPPKREGGSVCGTQIGWAGVGAALA
jgi:hypothetical protein